MAKPDTTDTSHFVRYTACLAGAFCLLGVALSLLHKLLPLVPVLVPGAIGWWLWQRHTRTQQRQQKSLNTAFYQLLREQQGRMTLLDFALATELPAIAARHYLDRRAKEFAARFDVTDQGDVVYVFSALAFPHPPAPRSQPAPAALTVSARPTLPASLTQTELAKRLGVAAKTVSRQKLSPNLIDWTRGRDPDRVGWSYSVV